MSPPINTSEARKLRSEYDKLRPVTMDLIGDLIGKELIAVHGEALLLHCMVKSKVDFQSGFQLLHAVHAFETTLRKFRDQRCTFHVIWFDTHRELCIPPECPDEDKDKYLLARSIIMEHLRRQTCVSAHSSKQQFSFCFLSLNSDDFAHYLSENKVQAFMCSDGRRHLESREQPLSSVSLTQHQYIILRVRSLRYSIGLVDDLAFASSKMRASVISPSQNWTSSTNGLESLETSFGIDHELPPTGGRVLSLYQKLQESNKVADHSSASEVVSALVFAELILDGPSGTSQELQVFALAFGAHLAVLKESSLSIRSLPLPPDAAQMAIRPFVKAFSQKATTILKVLCGRKEFSSCHWNAYDMIDGRALLQIFHKNPMIHVAESIKSGAQNFWALIKSLLENNQDYPFAWEQGGSISNAENRNEDGDMAVLAISSAAATGPGDTQPVLPFSHPVLDHHMEDVQIKTDSSSYVVPASSERIFIELRHWHNSRKLLDTKRAPKAKGFLARRKDQRFMANTIAYAASLTNASGKTLTPEIIVTTKYVGEQKAKETVEQTDWRAAMKQNHTARAFKTGPGKKRSEKKGGKAQAHEAVRAVQASKQDTKLASVLTFWMATFAGMEKEKNLLKRYLAAVKFLKDLSSDSSAIIGPCVTLYCCHLLIQLWKQYGATSPQNVSALGIKDGLDILALLWYRLQAVLGMLVPSEAVEQVAVIVASLKLPQTILPQATAAPSIEATLQAFQKLGSLFKMSFTLPTQPLRFQLKHCGPYLDRSFDSAPDRRVPSFFPDRWQRDVLDAIDAEKSLLVIAPTSAGKTFISFYAMKKILQANDNDVIVYVAPTKALVNQIAAEVQARLTKTYYPDRGRSVWAIYTRDYRINNPTGCQVLITVPHILQIMLLSPSNANKENPWTSRVRRIIFDEVHCIGQVEDGVVWEQLLLMAPCPIIALSATIGNPDELEDWLRATSETKGFSVKKIVHEHRYSDLRKFVYVPPETQPSFEGLQHRERLPVPGLDLSKHAADRFAFVHPVAAIPDRNPQKLEDTNLEARDCLDLWTYMEKFQNDRYPLADALSPEAALPAIVKKTNVTKWEKQLKDQLRGWMGCTDSPFRALQSELHKPLAASVTKTVSRKRRIETAFNLVCDLFACGALPAILFGFDRQLCEKILSSILAQLVEHETKWKSASAEWKKKLSRYEKWKKEAARAAEKSEHVTKERGAKAEIERMMAGKEISPWDDFDPEAPSEPFSFAAQRKISQPELDRCIQRLESAHIDRLFIDGLKRGIGVHHAGMNLQYRQIVEMLFRRGYLTVVVSTSTLALGLNMPCKTVVFIDDSIFLTALSYRQASGRAGRRGFDLLGNIVFHGFELGRVLDIMSSSLPDLRGQFPISTPLVLRVLSLLHQTQNSTYAVNTAKSLFSQTRVFLGGSAAQTSIKHHLRFSIEYLRRQDLLSADGKPLNFACLICHLYYTENAVFAFHSLLKQGYFHKLCANIKSKRTQILRELMLVLSHLFERVPFHKYRDATWLEEHVKKSASIVQLPALPNSAKAVLTAHNDEILQIFRAYVASYAQQYLADTPDDRLPFSGLRVGAFDSPANLMGLLSSHPPTTIRSPFAALSGFNDSFSSVGELCATVRAGVYLEEEAVPYITVYPEETGGVPWNAYLYDFFKHGSMQALEHGNGIKTGRVWEMLKSFSLVLAAIVTTFESYFKPDDDEIDVLVEDEGDSSDEGQFDDEPRSKVQLGKLPRAVGFKKKKAVADAWDDESDTDAALETIIGRSTSEDGRSSVRGSIPSWDDDDDDEDTSGESLKNVWRAFKELREEFDAKFKKEWA